MSMSDSQLSSTRSFLADPGTSATQSIQIENATGGTWTGTFDGQTTAAIAYNAGTNIVQNTFCALSNVGVGNLIANDSTGVPGSYFYALYFGGDLGHIAQPMFTVDASALTGIGVIATVQLVTAGGIVAFSDEELNANYDLANGNFYLGIAYGFDQLAAPGAKFNDYTAGQTSEKKSQIFDHLIERAAFFHQWANASDQVLFASMVLEPPRVQAIPWTQGIPATALNYRPPYGSRWGRRGW